MLPDQQMELMRTTLDVNVVDVVSIGTEHGLHAPANHLIREGL